MATGSGADELVGGYTIVSGEKFGKPEPEDRVKGSTVRFTGDKVIVKDKTNQETYSATYTVDTTHTPWRISMTASNAPNSGQTAEGLIEKAGDTIRLIYSLPGTEAPTDFKTKPGQLMFEMFNFNK